MTGQTQVGLLRVGVGVGLLLFDLIIPHTTVIIKTYQHTKIRFSVGVAGWFIKKVNILPLNTRFLDATN